MLENSAQIVGLQEKFRENIAPPYHIVKITEVALNKERERNKRRLFKIVQGSSKFHIMILTQAVQNFGHSFIFACVTCVKFSMGAVHSFNFINCWFIKLFLRSIVPSTPPPEIVGQEQVNDFIKAGSFVPVAAPGSSKDTACFIQVLETCLASSEVSKDDCNSRETRRNHL